MLFLLTWALEQVATRLRLSSGKIVLCWERAVDDRDALHAGYLTASGQVVDATGVYPLAEFITTYSTDGWDCAIVPINVLEENGYVFPEDVGSHDEAIGVAERLTSFLA